MRRLIDDKEQEINQLRKQNEDMRKMIRELESNSKADQKKIRMLIKNNAKKRKLLRTDAIVQGWNEWTMAGDERCLDDEEQEKWEELDACWKSSDESADEAD